MGWFTRLVTSFYAWSDLIIKIRQDKANKAYKIQTAEKKAKQIMAEHQKKFREKNNSTTAVDSTVAGKGSFRKRDYLPNVQVAEQELSFEQLLEMSDYLEELLELELLA